MIEEATRVLLGLLFIGHGSQKLFRTTPGHILHPWFGGIGFGEYRKIFHDFGLTPATPAVLAAGSGQIIGGALLAIGFLTPLACWLLLVTLIVGILVAQLDKGPWVLNGGWEYAVVLAIVVLAYVERGPGAISADARLGLAMSGGAVTWIVLGTAIAISFAIFANTRIALATRSRAATR